MVSFVVSVGSGVGDAGSSVTFNKDIAPILWTHCATCHRPGQMAPFSLLEYGDVVSRARQIATVTANHTMPPWLPEPGYGTFVNERRLKPEEVAAIQQWVKDGAPRGDANDLPPTRQRGVTAGNSARQTSWFRSRSRSSFRQATATCSGTSPFRSRLRRRGM